MTCPLCKAAVFPGTLLENGSDNGSTLDEPAKGLLTSSTPFDRPDKSGIRVNPPPVSGKP